MVRSNLGNVYKSKTWAERFARGRPVRRVAGGWQICRGQKKASAAKVAKRRKRKRKKSRRKTYKKKSTAQNARKKGQSVYKVKGGWRIGKRRKR